MDRVRTLLTERLINNQFQIFNSRGLEFLFVYFLQQLIVTAGIDRLMVLKDLELKTIHNLQGSIPVDLGQLSRQVVNIAELFQVG